MLELRANAELTEHQAPEERMVSMVLMARPEARAREVMLVCPAFREGPVPRASMEIRAIVESRVHSARMGCLDLKEPTAIWDRTAPRGFGAYPALTGTRALTARMAREVLLAKSELLV
jgi:hypothetical protein